jgi:Cu(I)/Ag(I) efflux system membrane fusion protein/cobalt-zinc-cadmium efflux system membrane fusion protein
MRAHRDGGRILGALLLALLLGAAGVAAGVRWHAEIARRVPVAWLAHGDATRDGARGAGETGVLYTCGMHPQVIQEGPGTCPICGMQLTPIKPAGAPGATPAGERKVRYWWDPMLSPPFISDKPGKSPMGMELIPVYEDEIAAGPAVVIDPTVVQNMGVRTATVVEAPLVRSLRLFGVLEEPEPDHVDVNLRVGGWIQKLWADSDGMPVKEGDPLFELYSPELNVAVEELIAARKAVASQAPEPSVAGGTAQVLLESARRKLELWGVDAAQVDRLAALDSAPGAVVFSSPMTGHVTKKMVYEGASVAAGELVMRIARRDRMWLELKVQEQDLPHLALGQRVTIDVDAAPDAVFAGEIVFFHPHLDMMTRTARARVLVPNESHVLREGMYAIAEVEIDALPRAIQVPREAIIDTGTRQIAFIALQTGHYEPRNVHMGLSGRDGLVQVVQGLAPGEVVVTSGQFLLDAESRLREALQKYLQQRSPAAKAAGAVAVELPIAASAEWHAAADAAFAAYLALAQELGRPGEDAVEPDVAPLEAAAKELVARAPAGEPETLSKKVRDAVEALRAAKPGRRRDSFKGASAAMVELATRAPPSRSVAARLFVVHCPMAQADWLQDREPVANPYFGREMKGCGSVERTIHGVDR